MSGREQAIISSIIVFLFICASAMAAELEYLSPERQHELENQFQSARFDSANNAEKLRNREWSCEMYGVRTRLQVQRDVKLYRWPSDSWNNLGAQILSDYKAEPSALVARSARFEDQVKLTTEGRLVSRLTLNSPGRTVIAYSVCKSL
jgi:hypothetical protein